MLSSIIVLLIGEMSGPCGTPYIMEHHLKLPRISNQTFFDTTHFRIHYDTTGDWAVDTAYVRKIARAAEYSWEIEVDSLGFDAPPPDNGAGGNDLYDIHIAQLYGSALGYTQPENPGPDPNQEDYISHIVVTRNLSDQLIEAVVSHEFNHACQFSYTANDGTWFYENTAVWAEEMVYPDNQQYVGYLAGTGPLKRPNYPITHMKNPSDLYEYAGVCWTLFLTFWTGDTGVIESIWDSMGLHWGNHTLEDIDGVLRRSYSDSLESAFMDYAVWRWFTDSHYDDYHWSEADQWPSATKVRSHDHYPAAGDQGVWNIYGPGGADFIVFTDFSDHDSLYFYFDGQDGGWKWGARVIGYRSGPANPSDIYEIPLDTTGYGALAVPTADYDSLILVPYCMNWFNTTPELGFTYWVNTVDVSEDLAAGTGFSARTTPKGLLLQLPEASVVRVQLYDPAGRTVWSTDFQARAGSNQLELPELNSGVYFWKISYQHKDLFGKIAR